MMSNWLKLTGIASALFGAAVFAGCGAGDGDGFAGDQTGDQSASADEMEIGSVAEGLMTCSNPDGTNAIMAAFAVAVAQDLGRWNASKDFQLNMTSGWSESSWGSQQAIKLTNGSDINGPIGKSRCADGRCAHVQALLDMQYDQANNQVYIQGTGTTKVLLNPGALRSRMYAKWQDQVACDKNARDGDLNSCTKEQNHLVFSGSAKGGCDTNFTFTAKEPTGAALKYPNQLKNELRFADSTNPYINFQNLGNGLVSIDPTYGLDEDGVSTVGSCTAACTKISPSVSYAGQCCSCAGATKKFSKAFWTSGLYLCL
jgi:hypothetical protein